MKKKNKMRGVTLIEIAIVLVIIGLLLGGVLKGQELINNARIRAIADRTTAVQVAWFAFQDRFRARPGDWNRAFTNLPQARNGDGNGVIEAGESANAFAHLTKADLLRCPQCTLSAANATALDAVSTINNTLVNDYGGIQGLFSDAANYAIQLPGGTTVPQRVQLHSGNLIPSNILAQVDGKLDDGASHRGDFRFSQINVGSLPAGHLPATAGVAPLVPLSCITATSATAAANGALISTANEDPEATAGWRRANQQPATEPNCAAVFIII